MFEATLVPGIKGEAIEMCGTEGRLWIDRSRYEWSSGSQNPGRSSEGGTITQSS